MQKRDNFSFFQNQHTHLHKINSGFVVRCHELVNGGELPTYPKFTAGPGEALTTNPQLLLFMREERVNDPTM